MYRVLGIEVEQSGMGDLYIIQRFRWLCPVSQHGGHEFWIHRRNRFHLYEKLVHLSPSQFYYSCTQPFEH